MATTRVIVTDHFRKYEDQLDRAVKHGLEKAAVVGVAAARSTPTKYRLQPILGKVHATRATKTPKGWQVLIAAPDWRSFFFLFGTYQRRKKKLSVKTVARRSSGSGQARLAKHGANRGVKPVRFLQRGRREAGKVLADLIEREMRLH